MLQTTDHIGARIRKLRLEHALSQDDLAARSGVSRRAIADAEHGLRSRPSTVRKIALALGVQPTHLTVGR